MKLARLMIPVLALAATLAHAQNLDVPAGSSAAMNTPARGSTMSSVESRFGAPTTKRGAVGDPPITRWDYPQFSVFFEHDRVIHAVIVR